MKWFLPIWSKPKV